MSSLAGFRPISDEAHQSSAIDRHSRRMSDPHDPERLSFLAKPLPPGFEMRVVTVAPGSTRAYQEA
jgi:hypothetical protein